MRGRFAPSPTGGLHLGNARTALLAWGRARAQGGAFVLRVEDLDTPRTVAAASDGNLGELRWLGLDWDEGPDAGGAFGPYRQSERTAHYAAALDRLRAVGVVAEDWLSRRDLRSAASAPHGFTGPVYGPAERRRSDAIAGERRAAGRAPALRARLPAGEVAFRDELRDERRVDVERDVGDVIVRRSDGIWAYNLAVVVDDHAMGITEVVRGDDLLSATGAQVALCAALGFAPPRYAHAPMLLDAAGARLAKRSGGGTLAALRAEGVDPRRVVGALAASVGWLGSPRPTTPGALLAEVDATRWSTEASAWTDDLDAWVRAG